MGQGAPVELDPGPDEMFVDERPGGGGIRIFRHFDMLQRIRRPRFYQAPFDYLVVNVQSLPETAHSESLMSFPFPTALTFQE